MDINIHNICMRAAGELGQSLALPALRDEGDADDDDYRTGRYISRMVARWGGSDCSSTSPEPECDSSD